MHFDICPNGCFFERQHSSANLSTYSHLPVRYWVKCAGNVVVPSVFTIDVNVDVIVDDARDHKVVVSIGYISTKFSKLLLKCRRAEISRATHT